MPTAAWKWQWNWNTAPSLGTVTVNFADLPGSICLSIDRSSDVNVCGRLPSFFGLEGDLLAGLRLDEGGIEVLVVELHFERGARLRAHVLGALDGDLLAELHRGFRGRRQGCRREHEYERGHCRHERDRSHGLHERPPCLDGLRTGWPWGLHQRPRDTLAPGNLPISGPRSYSCGLFQTTRWWRGSLPAIRMRRRRSSGASNVASSAWPARSCPTTVRPRTSHRRRFSVPGVTRRPTTRDAGAWWVGCSRSPAISRSTQSVCAGRSASTRRS